MECQMNISLCIKKKKNAYTNNIQDYFAFPHKSYNESNNLVFNKLQVFLIWVHSISSLVINMYSFLVAYICHILHL